MSRGLQSEQTCYFAARTEDQAMISLPADLSALVDARVSSGRYASAEDVLYAALDALEVREDEDLAAIRRGLEELEAGLGTPAELSNKSFRKRFGLAPRA